MSAPTTKGETDKCVHCKRDVLKGATKCEHCGGDLIFAVEAMKAVGALLQIIGILLALWFVYQWVSANP